MNVNNKCTLKTNNVGERFNLFQPERSGGAGEGGGGWGGGDGRKVSVPISTFENSLDI